MLAPYFVAVVHLNSKLRRSVTGHHFGLLQPFQRVMRQLGVGLGKVRKADLRFSSVPLGACTGKAIPAFRGPCPWLSAAFFSRYAGPVSCFS